MAVRPHRVLDDGRVVHFEDGPLSFQDLRDTWVHLRTHRRRRPVEAWVNDEQAHALLLTEEVRGYRFFGHEDPIHRHPQEVATMLGMRIMRGQPPQTEYRPGYEHPATYAQWVLNNDAPRVTTTPTWTFDQARGQFDAWKVQFGTGALTGTRIEGIWYDEPKRQVETTHENW